MSKIMSEPRRNKCDCGKRVLNHHWWCDKCWNKKNKDKNMIETKRKQEERRGPLYGKMPRTKRGNTSSSVVRRT